MHITYFYFCVHYSVLTWTDYEGIMLTEISHMEKDKYHMISLICGMY